MAENKTAVTLEEYKTALTKIALQDNKIVQLTKQLNEEIAKNDIVGVKVEAATIAEKDALIERLTEGSHGKFTREQLSKESLEQLYIRDDTLTKTDTKGFISVARQQEIDAAAKVRGTVGSFNQQTGKYEGGLE